ncbi:hypothetical protein T439DRAFT_357035 [Meredithblackwellia eburnea MCA 4105]
MPWAKTSDLSTRLEQREQDLMPNCTFEADGKPKCTQNEDMMATSWAFLLDPEKLAKQFSLVQRKSIRRDWMLKTLGLEETDVYTFPDQKRYNWKVYDTPPTPSSEPLDHWNLTFNARLELSSLRSLSSYKLLEFGSLFGSRRLAFEQPQNTALQSNTKRLMAYSWRNPSLEAISEAIADRLGGRENYVSAHLRVGRHDKFSKGAVGRMEEVFAKLVQAMGLDQSSVDQLVREVGVQRQTGKPATTRSFSLVEESWDNTTERNLSNSPSRSLRCKSRLHGSDTPWAALNKPVYVGTDAEHPRTHEALQPFVRSLPCLFFLHDFQTVNTLNLEPVVELDRLRNMTDEQGKPVEKWMLPLIELEVVAKARTAIGTLGSSFSAFGAAHLHASYWNPQRESEGLEWR